MPTIDVVTSEGGLAALADEWRDLWGRDPTAPIWESFEWHWNAWKLIPRSRSSRPLVAVVREAGRAVLILPMVSDRRAGLRRGRWMGPFVAFYEGPVTAGGRSDDARLKAAWQAVVEEGELDYCVFENVRHDGPLYAAVSAVAERYEYPRPVYSVQWEDWRDWDAYWEGRSTGLRQDQRRQWRRLEAAGHVAIACTVGVEEGGRSLDWLVDHKLDWIHREGKRSGWFGVRTVPFLRAVLPVANDMGRLFAGRLAVDGETIAMNFGFVGRAGMVSAVTTYHPAWHDYSPGRLLAERCLRFSHDHGHAFFDFLTATSPAEVAHKSKFAEVAASASALVIPFTPGGRAYAGWFGSALRERARSAYSRLPELRNRFGTRPRG